LYERTTRSDSFARYHKDLAKRLTIALSRGYSKGKGEVKHVETIGKIVNSVKKLSMSGQLLQGMPFELSTKSVFVHGGKSHVKFDYYGKHTGPVELGDLIFICTVVFNRKKYFEKMTITQFKKDKTRRNRIYWVIDNDKQLYLLSRFPTFKCIRGIIPKLSFDLANISGCLGSYAFLHRPGDFAFLSAVRLDSFTAGKKTVRQEDLGKFAVSERPAIFCRSVLNDCLFTSNVYSFAYNYLKLNIGEPVFTKYGNYDPQVRSFLTKLFLAFLKQSKREKGSRRVVRFVKSFQQFEYADEDQQRVSADDPDFTLGFGGMGIIHTTVKIGE
jgi:hypothetical protein